VAGQALAAGTYKGTITLTPTTPGYTTPVIVPVNLVLSASVPAAPVIGSNGVVNGASFQAGAGIAPNSYVTITGTNLASTTDNWNNSIVGGELPTSLDGVTVTFSGVPGYLSYISPTQINVLVPSIPIGTASIQVSNNGSVGSANGWGGSIFAGVLYSGYAGSRHTAGLQLCAEERNGVGRGHCPGQAWRCVDSMGHGIRPDDAGDAVGSGDAERQVVRDKYSSVGHD
jgi:hypothetical protein